MACPTMTITGVTRDVWDCLLQRASGMGITVPPGERGSIRHPDADADYAWEEDTGMLTVTVTRRPAWIGCDRAEARICEAVRGCGAG